jgi:hypothetical protein
MHADSMAVAGIPVLIWDAVGDHLGNAAGDDMKRKDLLWLLFFPAYLILGTLRHEGFHALAAAAEGAEIQEFVFWPSIGPRDKFYFGYVSWQGATTWVTTAAPYVGDLLTFVVGVLICTSFKIRRRGLWVNILIITMLSPLLNSAYNYMVGMRRLNDIGSLLQALSPPVVHLYFALTMALYGSGFWFFFRKNTAPDRPI